MKMRTEEWTCDQSGMIETALAEVYEPGDLPDRVRKDTVLVDHEVFTELMTRLDYAQR
jgi:hypothetical protein